VVVVILSILLFATKRYRLQMRTSEGTHTASIEFELNEEKNFDRLLLSENIRHRQRVEKFTLEAFNEGSWRKSNSPSSSPRG